MNRIETNFIPVDKYISSVFGINSAKDFYESAFVIRYSLFVIRYSLFVIRYSLFVIRYSLFVIR